MITVRLGDSANGVRPSARHGSDHQLDRFQPFEIGCGDGIRDVVDRDRDAVVHLAHVRTDGAEAVQAAMGSGAVELPPPVNRFAENLSRAQAGMA